jgi:hypothetical protein
MLALALASSALATKPLPDLEIELVVGGEASRVDGAQAAWAAVHAVNDVLASTSPVRAKPMHRWNEVLQGRCVVVRFGDAAHYEYHGKRVRELRLPLPGEGFFGAEAAFPDSAFALFEQPRPPGAGGGGQGDGVDRWRAWLGGVPEATRARLAEAMRHPDQ